MFAAVTVLLVVWRNRLWGHLLRQAEAALEHLIVQMDDSWTLPRDVQLPILSEVVARLTNRVLLRHFSLLQAEKFTCRHRVTIVSSVLKLREVL